MKYEKLISELDLNDIVIGIAEELGSEAAEDFENRLYNLMAQNSMVPEARNSVFIRDNENHREIQKNIKINSNVTKEQKAMIANQALEFILPSVRKTIHLGEIIRPLSAKIKDVVTNEIYIREGAVDRFVRQESIKAINNVEINTRVEAELKPLVSQIKNNIFHAMQEDGLLSPSKNPNMISYEGHINIVSPKTPSIEQKSRYKAIATDLVNVKLDILERTRAESVKKSVSGIITDLPKTKKSPSPSPTSITQTKDNPQKSSPYR